MNLTDAALRFLAARMPAGELAELFILERAERARLRAERRAARLAAGIAAKLNEADSPRPVESGSIEPVQSVGGPVKDRARRGLMLASQLKPATRAVGAVLIERFNLRSGRCDPGIGDIASKTGLSDRSVRRALADLDARGLIVRIVHGGMRHANAYRPDWEKLAALVDWPVAPAAKMNDPDSGTTRTLLAADPDTGVRQNLPRNLQASVRRVRPVVPDRRQGALLLPIPGKAQVAEASAQARLWSDVQAHFTPQGARAFEAATLRLMEGGLGERAAEAEQVKRGDGLRMVLNVLREAG